MSRYDQRIHIGCGGNLTFEKEVRENKVLNQRAVDKFGAKAKIRSINKQMHRCDKCRALINVITCPSWEEYVLRGQIRVPFHILRRIRNRDASLKRGK